MLNLAILILCVTGSALSNYEEEFLSLSMRIDGVTRKVINLRKNVSSLDQRLHEHMDVSAICELEKLPEITNANIKQVMSRMIRREEQLKRQQLRMLREISQIKDEVAFYRSSKENGKGRQTEQFQEMVNQLRNELQELKDGQEMTSRRLAVAVGCMKKQLENPSFEVSGGWVPHKEGYETVSNEAQDGVKSAKVTRGGVSKILTFPEPIRRLVVSGWSKNMGGPPSIKRWSDFSLYCDLQTSSKENLWGYATPFTLRNSSWHQVTVKIDLPPRKAIVRATCYFLYRNIDQGVAYFDNMSASLPSDDVTDLSVCIHR